MKIFLYIYAILSLAFGEILKVPKGIDPDWNYNIGRTAWGEKWQENIMTEKERGKWKPLLKTNWESYGLPAIIPLDKPKASLKYTIPQTKEGIKNFLTSLFGREETTFQFQKGGLNCSVFISATKLADHIEPNRAPFLPLLKETIEEPNEVWLSFEENTKTGYVALRQRYIKAFELRKGLGMIFITDARKGALESLTFFPITKFKYLNARRSGRLLWKKY